MKNLLNILKKVLTYKVNNPFNFLSKVKQATEVSDTYFMYSKYILKQFSENPEFYEKYWSDYNRIFQHEGVYLGHHGNNNINWIKYIKEYEEKNREIENTFLDLPIFKEMNREKNLYELLK